MKIFITGALDLSARISFGMFSEPAKIIRSPIMTN